MTYNSQKVISFGFGLMLLFLILITTVGLTNITALNDEINDLVHIRNAKTSLISDMRNIARERSLSLYRMVLLKDPFDIDEEQVHMSLLAGQFLKDREQLFNIEMTAAEQKNIEQTLEHVYASTKIQKELLSIIKTESFDKAQEFLMNTAIPEQNRLLLKYDQLLDFQNEISKNVALDADKKHQSTLIFLFMFSLSIITIGVLVSLYVIKKSTKAERQLREANETLETHVLNRTTSLYHANQELQATVETLQDTQAQLVQAEKMASLGSLVAGISHEINTPIGVGLTAITYLQGQQQDFTANYEADTLTQEDFEKYLQQSHEACNIVAKNINRAAELIKNFKQIAVDQSHEVFSTIDLCKYIDDILLSLNPKLKQTNITIENHCDPHLSLYTDPGVIYQVLSNLILNSLLHAYEENETGTIVITAEKKSDAIQIKYCDDGKGIAPENLNSIFDPFFTTRRGSGGSGLGLHIVFNLITSTLEGSIKVKNGEDKGCCFFIKLPLFNNAD